jgi:hypothetical protein
MAVIALETSRAHPAQCIAASLGAASAAIGAVIDSYVSYRMQTSASQTEQVCQLAAGLATATTSPALSAQPEAPPSGDMDEETERALQPLDPGTISDAIPAFYVGRNRDGLWVARHAKGESGGIFLFKASATSFARRYSGSTGCATIFPAERFELDIPNSGNPLAGPIGSSIRFVRLLLRLITAASSATRRR